MYIINCIYKLNSGIGIDYLSKYGGAVDQEKSYRYKTEKAAQKKIKIFIEQDKKQEENNIIEYKIEKLYI